MITFESTHKLFKIGNRLLNLKHFTQKLINTFTNHIDNLHKKNINL